MVTAHPEETYDALAQSDAQLKTLKLEQYRQLASEESLKKTVAALEGKKYKVHVVNNKAEALKAVVSLVPKGASVFNTHSTSLEEIGLVEHMKQDKEWNNLHAKIWATQDPAQQAKLTREAHCADYVFSSVAAVSEQGDLLAADASGTKVGPFAYTGGMLVLVIGTQKIVPSYEEAVKRLHELALQVESARVRIAYKIPASQISNLVAIRESNPFSPVNRITVIFVKEPLGY